jgi:thioredoxin-like negative regulator of GroEL
VVIIAFVASWKEQCKLFCPLFAELALNQKQFLFCQVDIDKSEDIAKEYEVTGVPQVNIFYKGSMKGRLVNTTMD